MNAVMNFGLDKLRVICGPAEDRLDCEETLLYGVSQSVIRSVVRVM